MNYLVNCQYTQVHTYLKIYTDNLFQDGRSNTWPQQPQPWSHSSQALNLGDPNDQAHRPVTMQLSDPLTQRNFWMNPGDANCSS